MEKKAYSKYTMVSGTNIIIPVTDRINYYFINKTSVTLSSNWEVTTSGTLVEGMICDIVLSGGSFTPGSNTVTVLGKVIPTEMLKGGNVCFIKAHYTGSAWQIYILSNIDNEEYILEGYIANEAVTTAKINDDAVTPVKMSSGGTAGLIYIDDGSIINQVAISGAITITAGGIASLATGGVTVANLGGTLKREVITMLVHWAKIGNIPYRVPYDCTVMSITGSFVEALTIGTGDLFKLQNNAGTDMTGSEITFSTNQGEGTQTATYAVTGNNTITAGQNIIAVSAGTATAGLCILQIEVERS